MKIVLGTGGTGGHLFPALKVAAELKEQKHDILFLGSFDRGMKQMKESGFSFIDLPARGVKLSNIKSVFLMAKAIVMAFRQLRVFKPEVVIGFGGYGAFPVVFSGVLLKCPAIIHEQNVVPGRANAILSKIVGKVAISFKRSERYFKKDKTVLTGCPTHVMKNSVDRDEIRSNFSLEPDRLTILVFGGSQGSQPINEIFIETAQSLKNDVNFQIIHLSGKNDYDRLKKYYNQLGVPFALFEYLENIEQAYSVADIVISRAGALTVTELAMFQVPAILIPYPFARGHQKENALVLSEAGAAVVLEERDLSVNGLKDAILKLASQKKGNHKSNDIYISDSAKRIAFEAIHLVL